jgi:hypothetical protein
MEGMQGIKFMVKKVQNLGAHVHAPELYAFVHITSRHELTLPRTTPQQRTMWVGTKKGLSPPAVKGVRSTSRSCLSLILRVLSRPRRYQCMPDSEGRGTKGDAEHTLLRLTSLLEKTIGSSRVTKTEY